MRLVILERNTENDKLQQLGALDTKVFEKHVSGYSSVLQDAYKPGNIVIIAENEILEVCGYALVTCNSVSGRIVRLAVDPTMQRRGIGRKLMNEAIKQLRKCMCITLHVSVTSTPALSLYQSMGFEIQERREDYYGVGEDALFMELSTM